MADVLSSSKRLSGKKRKGEDWFSKTDDTLMVFDDRQSEWTEARLVTHLDKDFLVYETEVTNQEYKRNKIRHYPVAYGIDCIDDGSRAILYEAFYDKAGNKEVGPRTAKRNGHIRKWVLADQRKDTFGRKTTNFVLDKGKKIIEARSRSSYDARVDFVVGSRLSSLERLFLVGGFTTTVGYWVHMYDHLANDVQTLSLRIRGHNVSREGRRMDNPREFIGTFYPNPDLYLASCADDVFVAHTETNAILHHLAILSKAQINDEFSLGDARSMNHSKTPDKFDLIGHSMGGMIGREAYVQNPDYVNSLILLCSPPVKIGFGQYLRWNFLRQFDGNKALERIVDAYSHLIDNQITRTIGLGLSGVMCSSPRFRKLAYTMYTAESMASGVNTMASEDFDNWVGKIAQTPSNTLDYVISAMEQYDHSGFREKAKKGEIPIIVIAGEKDQIVCPEKCREEAESINALYVEIKNGGHAPNLETPEEFHTIVDEFRKEGEVRDRKWLKIIDYRNS